MVDLVDLSYCYMVLVCLGFQMFCAVLLYHWSICLVFHISLSESNKKVSYTQIEVVNKREGMKQLLAQELLLSLPGISNSTEG